MITRVGWRDAITARTSRWSIAQRLLLSAAIWSFVILLAAGLLLIAILQRSTEAEFDRRLGVYLRALVADVASGGSEERTEPGQLGDPQFELARSGWYWQITRLDAETGDIKASRSLNAAALPSLADQKVAAEPGGLRKGYVTGPDDRRLRMLERFIDAGDEGRYLVQVAATTEDMEFELASFELLLGGTFAALALALIGSAWFQVRYGLAPLRRLQDGLVSIRRGETEKIMGQFPDDLAPLAGELNLMLDTNRDFVERARTQVGNLAHALKTPLSVILNEARGEDTALARKMVEQSGMMREQVELYLDRARAAARASRPGVVTDLAPVLERLVRTFEKICRDRGLTFALSVEDGLRFMGEAQDLEEMVGNLIDNAGKWARSAITISAASEPPPDAAARPLLRIEIDDDGPGLPAEGRAAAVRRGTRLDESKPGSGLGLSIVVDLAGLYRGSLTLDETRNGGLRALLRLPAA